MTPLPTIDAANTNRSAASLGTPDERLQSAVSHLKRAMSGTDGERIQVSAAAVGLLVDHAEQMATSLGLIRDRAVNLERVVDDLIAIRPSNWDDPADPNQAAAWRAAEAAQRQMRRQQ